MASLIESVCKLHGPKLIEHENGYDVDVLCAECTDLRAQALERASSDGEDWGYGTEVAHVPYPCNTRVVAGTTVAEGKDESARMRLDHLVIQRDELEERMERLDAVIGLIRRDLDGATEEPEETDEADNEKSSETMSTRSKDSDSATDAEGENGGKAPASATPAPSSDPADDFDF